jgi:hypothetical protein
MQVNMTLSFSLHYLKNEYFAKIKNKTMDLNNTVIEVLDKEHGKKVIQFFKDNGWDTGVYCGNETKIGNNSFHWYGVVDGNFGQYHRFSLKNYIKIIELPDTIKHGDEVDFSTNGKRWTNGGNYFVGYHPFSKEPMIVGEKSRLAYSFQHCRKHVPQEPPKPNFQKEIDELIEKAKKEGVELTVKIN